MATQDDKEQLALLQGTLDLLILRTLVFGPQHGQGIARSIQLTSKDELLVEHGALYPALQRLLADTAAWKIPKKLLVIAALPLTARGKPDTRALQAMMF